jgi:hypothetical protein
MLKTAKKLFRAGGWAAAAALGMTYMRRELGYPQYMVRHHPSIGKIYVIFKLNGNHFRINLHHDPFQPIAHTLSGSVMIAKNIYMITYLVGFIAIWSGSKM